MNAHIDVVTGTPHGVDKSDIGLNNADNTSDLNKPVSIDTQTALNLKADSNAPIVAGTNLKITYDAEGFVTSGSVAVMNDIDDVDTTSIAPGVDQVLTWNGTAWAPKVALGGEYYVAKFIPVAGTEYPDTTGETAGAYWIIDAAYLFFRWRSQW